MLEFSDAAYRFFPAEPSPTLIALGRSLNRAFILPGKNHRISELRIEGNTEAIREARRSGDRLIFVMNHPSHSDPQVMTELFRRLAIPSGFMAAYDVFLRSKFCAWSMRKLGNFSIDREAADRKAMAAAIAMVTEGRYSLGIFPEGNVYLTNDRVTPFLDGTAFIALKAQQAAENAKVKVVPVSLKFTHLTVPHEPVRRRLVELGEHSGHAYAPGSTDDPLGAILGLGRHLVGLNLQRHGLLREGELADATLYETLKHFVARLVGDVESALALTKAENSSLVDRIRKVRSTIHQIRSDVSTAPPIEIDGLAAKAILSFRVHGYLTPYLTENPTIDRYDETAERIAEDYFSKAMSRTGPRRAIARIHEPIDVAACLEREGSLRKAVGSLTRGMERSVQEGIDAINAANDAPGAARVPGV